MATIAEKLLAVLREAPIAGPYRRKKLAELQVRFEKNGARHQIADFQRHGGAWVSGCGLFYEGNGYIEDSHEGLVDCMLCIADADDVPG